LIPVNSAARAARYDGAMADRGLNRVGLLDLDALRRAVLMRDPFAFGPFSFQLARVSSSTDRGRAAISDRQPVKPEWRSRHEPAFPERAVMS
jgi:hypothetical protein